jgi:hypothetical protein
MIDRNVTWRLHISRTDTRSTRVGNKSTLRKSQNSKYSAFEKSLCTYKRFSSIERTTVSKKWIKQLHTLPVLHFNRCLTTEYSETTAHFNGNFDTDNQNYVP